MCVSEQPRTALRANVIDCRFRSTGARLDVADKLDADGVSPSNEEYVVPMKLLAELSRASMPFQTTDREDLLKLRILRAWGYIQVTIPLPSPAFDGHWHRNPATVHRLTYLGRAMLRCLVPAGLDRVPEGGMAATGEVVRTDPLSFRVPPRLRRLS